MEALHTTFQTQSWFGGAWKSVKDWTQGAVQTVGITDKDFIDDLGVRIKDELGIDITSHEQNREWVQNALKFFMLDFDLSANCLVYYSELYIVINMLFIRSGKDTGETSDRSCGGAGDIGRISGQLLNYFQVQKNVK